MAFELDIVKWLQSFSNGFFGGCIFLKKKSSPSLVMKSIFIAIAASLLVSQ